MKLDIVIVTYNSEKWMKNCIESIENSFGVNMDDIYLHIIDNVSKDGTIDILNKIKEKSKIKEFEIIETGNNLGFGKANNEAAKNAKSDYIFFLNPDTVLDKNALFLATQDIESSKEDIGVWEFRQRPYEHPKIYDPLTLETSWVSGACFIIKKELFFKIGGFDKNIFMYAEDVDISWKARIAGYKLKYMPKAIVTHYCYEKAGQIKPTQYVYCLINNLNLRLKYGNYRKVCRWYAEFFKILGRPSAFKGSKKMLVNAYFKNLKYTNYYSSWKHKKENKEYTKYFSPKFYMFDYEVPRLGAFLPNTPLNETPLVSIIVRTCGRPNVLREALISLRNQTYNNIEIVVVEDGTNKSGDMIKKEFSDLNIVYKATNEKVGRCVVGNIALSMAKGEYLNFLDDDDLFYADHVETLVREMLNNKEYNVAYTLAFETKITVKSIEPEYIYEQKSLNYSHNEPFSRITLLTRNLFPIQAVMFKREVYEKLGGLDTELENLEDWELWARYGTENKFLKIEKITSLYRVPYIVEDYSKRQEEMDIYYKKARKKIFERTVTIPAKDLYEEIEASRH